MIVLKGRFELCFKYLQRSCGILHLVWKTVPCRESRGGETTVTKSRRRLWDLQAKGL